MKKSITSKLILGIIALVVIVGAGFLVFGKHSNANLGASVYGISTGTVTPRPICIRSGQFMSPPSITITSPNGGQTYTVGQQITVTWTSCNLPSNVQIGGGLVWPNGFSSNPSPSAFINYSNTGSLTYTLPGVNSFTSPNTFQYGNFYKISLDAVNPSTHSVIATTTSSNFFKINPSQLTLTSPSSGMFYQGQTMHITWAGGNASLPIFLNLDNNSNIQVGTIAASGTSYSNGSYYWLIPTSVTPGTYRLVLGQAGSANSWGPTFTIVAPPIQVSPNGTPTATVTTAGGGQQHDIINFSIPFSITAIGQTAVYVPHLVQMTDPQGIGGGNIIQYGIDNGGQSLSTGTVTGVLTYTGNGLLAPDANGNYQIAPGQTQNFVLNVTYQVSAAGNYRASLLNVNWNTNDSGAGLDYNIYTTGLNSTAYRTPYVAAQ